MSTKITITDRILANTVLRFIPAFITPNQITIFRIVTVPFVVLLLLNEMYVYAFPLFTLSIFTDAIDGAMARTQDKITDFGKIADPVADKLLIGATAIIVVSQFIGWMLTAIIVVIELFLVSLGMFKKFVQGHDVQAEWSGKTKLVLQAVGLIALLAYSVWPIPVLFTVALYSLYAAVFFALLSLIVYRAI